MWQSLSLASHVSTPCFDCFVALRASEVLDINHIESILSHRTKVTSYLLVLGQSTSNESCHVKRRPQETTASQVFCKNIIPVGCGRQHRSRALATKCTMALDSGTLCLEVLGAAFQHPSKFIRFALYANGATDAMQVLQTALLAKSMQFPNASSVRWFIIRYNRARWMCGQQSVHNYKYLGYKIPAIQGSKKEQHHTFTPRSYLI